MAERWLLSVWELSTESLNKTGPTGRRFDSGPGLRGRPSLAAAQYVSDELEVFLDMAVEQVDLDVGIRLGYIL